MKKTKKYNNISDELMKQVPRLKPNESAVFRMLNGVPNPEPDEKERSKSPVLYPKVQVLTSFRVFDKFQKNEDGTVGGGYVDVVCADSWFGEEPTKIRTFVPGNEKGRSMSQFQGKFELKGGVVRDEELYQVLWLSPQRKGTPCPDPSVEQIFELVDAASDNTQKLTKFDRLQKVIDITKSMSPADARRVMRALNQPEIQDENTLLITTKDYATRNVEVFIKTYENKDTYLRSELKECIDGGIIDHDLASGDIRLMGATIGNLKVSTPDAFLDAFTQWVNTAENGKDVLTNIRSQMSKKSEATV
jgi:hypothetical protein